MSCFVLFLCLLSFVLPNVSAQTCTSLDVTFQAPQVCKPSYLIPTQNAQNNTGGDTLSRALSSLSLSQTCAQAFTQYYCSVFYPECDSDNSSKTVCATTCNQVGSACANETSKFSKSPLSLPTCDSLPSTCSFSSSIDLSSYYTECAYAILNLTAFPAAEQQDHILCTPNYTIPTANVTIGASSYSSAQRVYDTFVDLAKALTTDTSEGVENWMYVCLKPFAGFYCSQYFPSCNNGAKAVLPVCRSVCEQVVQQCNNLTQSFALSPDMLQVPSSDECQSLPDDNCFTPTTLDTALDFFFGTDPPTPIITTTTTTTSTGEGSTTIVYPPGGAAAGGGLGAGVLVALLLIIFGLSLIMRRQDAR